MSTAAITQPALDRSPVRLYDTAGKAIVSYHPDAIVRMYICGITPYDATHLGHAATYVTYDILQRRLVDAGHEVRLVRNITDADDELLERAARDGINYLDLAFREKKGFDADLTRLGNLEPWREPRATSAIPDIRGFIAELLERDAAYIVNGSVYFRHDASGNFGSIGGYSEPEMIEIGRAKGEDPADPQKCHPLDTVLWKPSSRGEPAWESPWGPGRPGWHVECVALSHRELGPLVDIHGGGCDLVYPHHEFCAAQLDAGVTGSQTRIWMHQQCVQLHGEAMSKSTGNLIFLSELFAQHDPMVVRLAVMSKHYRIEVWEWTDELIPSATARLDSWRSAGTGDGPIDAVRSALDDDLDVPEALAIIDDATSNGGVDGAAALLGVRL